ncbi:mannosyltransferase family protein [Alicyclobacillus ferrooxydans]|uniref:Glycosyltransferase RgtA/B/C/D-like domain-containing protein n=1 Tax=Alicyclobacillus ferrooxydans TaxID=471514 RepID=A0A0N8PPA5_9BACL|nr:mannosyltransferase family protein [Alicyclobacillus ferrooxydans]KPV43781.1 hypothetical protein AN477_10360 [Alicyclobacillus ferrooxydans]
MSLTGRPIAWIRAHIRPLRLVWSIFIVHLLLVLVTVAVWQHYFGTLSKDILPRTYGVFIAGLSHWDGTWFLSVAKHGYTQSTPNATAFFPLYPLVMRLLAHLLSFGAHGHFSGPVGDRTYFLSGIIISNAAFLCALCLLYLIGTRRWSRTQTLRGLWLLALFPSSYYFSAVYSESLFLMFIAGGFLSAYQRRFALAGLCLALAALTRSLGVFAVPSMLWIIWVQFRAHRQWSVAFRNAVTVSVLPVVGLCTYFVWLEHVYRNPLMFMTAEKSHWHRHFDWLGKSLKLDYHNDPLGFLTCLLFLALLVLSIRALPFEQWLFSAIAFLIPLSSVAGKYPMSMIRFAAVLFPVFLFLGARIRRVETYQALVAVSIVVLVWLTGLFASAHWVA